MAGSYRHCIDDNGTFIGEYGQERFSGMIGNLGDAYEACEQMVFMIDYLAGGDREKIAMAEQAFYRQSEG
jgi:hypothetical protein